MPSHIYMRVGQYHDATMANERAVKADQSYIRNCQAQGFYPGVSLPNRSADGMPSSGVGPASMA